MNAAGAPPTLFSHNGDQYLVVVSTEEHTIDIKIKTQEFMYLKQD